ncbi:MAG: Maf family protein [Myxococcaceae bacterium]|nr:Maf family protein [Myxococcaceae bacterium]
MRLVLASSSPRRQELLRQLGLTFSVDPADLDEAVHPGEAPRAYVERLARAKAAAVAGRHPGAAVLAADTSVVVDERILGKPADEAEGRAMLGLLSGRTHEVLTAVAVQGASLESLVVSTAVRFRPLSAAEIAWYVGTGEGRDKAGGYASQARAGAFITAMTGSSTSVIGLPLAEAVAMLERAGVPMPWGSR